MKLVLTIPDSAFTSQAEAPVSEYSGVQHLEVSAETISDLYNSVGGLQLQKTEALCNESLILASPTSQALARVDRYGAVKLVPGDRRIYNLRGRSAEQRLAISLLTDPEVGIVSLGGPAGTGKTALALAAGLEALQAQEHGKVMVFRPLYAVGGQQLGFLPGTEGEKMGPWAAAIDDVLSVVETSPLKRRELKDKIEVLPLTHVRGRTFHDAWVIIDEAQQLDRTTLLTALSRIGQRSKVVLTHDVDQRDNRQVGKYGGIMQVIDRLKDHPLFGHITLVRSERSQIAALVTERLSS